MTKSIESECLEILHEYRTQYGFSIKHPIDARHFVSWLKSRMMNDLNGSDHYLEPLNERENRENDVDDCDWRCIYKYISLTLSDPITSPQTKLEVELFVDRLEDWIEGYVDARYGTYLFDIVEEHVFGSEIHFSNEAEVEKFCDFLKSRITTNLRQYLY